MSVIRYKGWGRLRCLLLMGGLGLSSCKKQANEQQSINHRIAELQDELSLVKKKKLI
ncbi:MAG: hypothetical protein HC880_17110 [Bacteroidia bacterium]|nr:hypothetical protein [Bacteroidia bacterium]